MSRTENVGKDQKSRLDVDAQAELTGFYLNLLSEFPHYDKIDVIRLIRESAIDS